VGFVHWSPIASSVVIVLFVVLIFRRYRRRGSTPLLLWGIGLTMFGIASLAEAYSAVRWQPVVFRLWYLSGAMLNAAWLGQGTVFLLSRRARLAWILLGLLIVGSLVGGYFVFRTPVDGTHFTVGAPLSAQYREILPPGATVRKLTPLFNIYGLLTLVGGALYSAWLVHRREDVPQRVVGNVLIAIGGLVLGFASTLVRLGWADYLYAAEFLAAASMFAGFLLATMGVPVRVSVSSHVGVTS
jgi:hypothetical protein